MTSSTLLISDRYEMLALHRGLMEARFCEFPNDADVSGSPILARFHRALLDRIVELEGADSAFRWRDWLKAGPERREWKVAVMRAASSSRWKGLNANERRELSRNLLAPFEISDESLSFFVAQVELAHENMAANR